MKTVARVELSLTTVVVVSGGGGCTPISCIEHVALHSETSMSVSHSPHAPRPGVTDAPRDAATNWFSAHRYLLSHALFTIVLLMALTAMVAWLLT